MENLNAVKREKKTSHEARKERRSGKIPGVLYGKNITNLLFEISELELAKEISKNGEHGIVNINIDGEEHKALIKELQKDPVNRKVVHIDLEKLSDNSVVVTDVPLVFIGEDKVAKNGGILQKEKNKVKVQCKGGNIPKSINIDVSNLSFGDTYRLCDVEFSNEITFVEDRNTVIATVTDGNTDVIIKDTPEVSSI
ncbi:50S ribosomal protein L25 [Clostridium sp. SYSU_GA19001]|uniref:50S ribosomal protein L25 n=1 Tax=Clostridium caldaquaticum TaxID=2940653 RepID=UPI00207751F6|nr:50S ribosomal protein L25 [Clostridium caldaquaticum]MCM8711271.1 50S ribosomal protein L25 [Clostridium caldaquaticum]